MPFSPLGLLDAFLCKPPPAERVAFLGQQAYAHRGLHGGTVPENSRAAFHGAIDKGLGIELDVQPAVGREAFVFHDDTLDRLTHETGPVGKRIATDLDRITLKGSTETIPRLAEILTLVAGRVPILIEVKSDSPTVNGICLGIRRVLEGYRGPVAIMSFNPEIPRWFHRHARRYVRGLVVTEGSDKSLRARIKGYFIRHFSLWRAKPDFLAYDIRNLPSSFAGAQRARGLAVLTWTVRTAADEAKAMASADEIIFERVGSVAGHLSAPHG
jgi:glycerophosphoryl diester phosphodiesterase